jgi:OmpA-OmpF porin, OOP family
MKVRNYVALGLGALAMLAAAGPARADGDGFYADVHGGVGIPFEEGARVSSDSALTSLNAHTNYDTGWLAGASAGYAWSLLNQSLATEFEFTFRQNHVDRIATSSQALTEGGDLHSYDMMLNQYYRFKNPSPFTPYIGGGIGESSVALNNTRPVGGLDTGPFSGTDAVLAYQGIAGVAYPIAPHLSLAAEYRYFATLRPGFEQNVANRDVKISPSYAVNNVLLRMVYAF